MTLFRECLNLEVASAQTDLRETGILDSLTLVEVLLQLESKYGVRISINDMELDNFRTIECIARCVSSLIAKQAVSEAQVLEKRTQQELSDAW